MPGTVVARPTSKSWTETYCSGERRELGYRVVTADGAWSRERIEGYLRAG
jgi:hypothetical protein